MEAGAKSGCDAAQQSQKLHIANPSLLCRGALQSAFAWLTDPAAAAKQLVEQQALATDSGRAASLGLLQVIEWTCSN